MRSASPARLLSAVRIGRSADVLGDIARPGVELAGWQRGPDPAWADWLAAMRNDDLPACRLELAPDDAARALNDHFDACGTPTGEPRDAFVADVAGLVACFAGLAATRTVRLRLDPIAGDACRRWHRDCVPLRLICTYLGPGTVWVPPAWSDAVLARLDDEAPQAMVFDTGDVALFKGCGWPGQAHDGGIVHRSPRIAGTGGRSPRAGARPSSRRPRRAALINCQGELDATLGTGAFAHDAYHRAVAARLADARPGRLRRCAHGGVHVGRHAMGGCGRARRQPGRPARALRVLPFAGCDAACGHRGPTQEGETLAGAGGIAAGCPGCGPPGVRSSTLPRSTRCHGLRDRPASAETLGRLRTPARSAHGGRSLRPPPHRLWSRPIGAAMPGSRDAVRSTVRIVRRRLTRTTTEESST